MEGFEVEPGTVDSLSRAVAGSAALLGAMLGSSRPVVEGAISAGGDGSSMDAFADAWSQLAALVGAAAGGLEIVGARGSDAAHAYDSTDRTAIRGHRS